MAMLERSTKGKIKKPHLILIYGTEGVGKSSFGAQAPNPYFICAENGTDDLDVTRCPPIKSWFDVSTLLMELVSAKHDYKTLVIDSLDWLEPILHKKITESYGAKTMELAAGGYGKAYKEAMTHWRDFKDALTELRDKRGMNIILIAHANIVDFNDPNAQVNYHRYQIKLHKEASALFKEFVDCVFFANYETLAKKEDGKVRTYADGARFIYTERRPGFDAKNRKGLPFSFLLSWPDFELAIAGSQPDPQKIKDQINTLAADFADEDFKKLVLDTVEKAGNNFSQLVAIENRLRIKLEEKNG